VEAVAATNSMAVRRTAYLRAAAVMAVVIGLDQLTKHLIRSNIAPGDTVHIFPGLKLVDWDNSGVAFSVFSGGGAVIYVLTAVALLALVGYLTAQPQRPWLWLPTGMLLGGAIGNLIDRIAHGAVTDFVKFPVWPAFNLADTSITFGVIILVVVFERRGRRRDGSTA
jgi:signal peptidase II